MSIGPCLNCGNKIERRSVVCPICGQSKSQVIIARIMRWSISFLVLALICYEVVHHHSAGHS